LIAFESFGVVRAQHPTKIPPSSQNYTKKKPCISKKRYRALETVKELQIHQFQTTKKV
jgi:hypothetical protein